MAHVAAVPGGEVDVAALEAAPVADLRVLNVAIFVDNPVHGVESFL